MTKRSGTVRRCVVCRKVAEKSALLRFVMREERVVWDERMSLPGRGGYIHRTLACWSKMAEPGMWEHAFRLKKGSMPRVVVTEAARAARAMIEEAAKSSSHSSKLRL